MKQGRSLKDVKAERAAKKRRAKRRRRAFVLIIEVLTLFILLGIGYVMNKYDKFQLNLFYNMIPFPDKRILSGKGKER